MFPLSTGVKIIGLGLDNSVPHQEKAAPWFVNILNVSLSTLNQLLLSGIFLIKIAMEYTLYSSLSNDSSIFNSFFLPDLI